MARRTNPTSNPPNSPLRLIAIICLALVVIVGLAVLITWLVIRPKTLQYSVEKGWIRDYNLTTNGKLNSTFNLVISAYNPNKKSSVYYDSIDVTLSYRGHNIATDTVEPFFQPRRNVTRLMFRRAARNVVLPISLVNEMKAERTGGEVMDLDVNIKGKVRFKVGVWKSRHYKLKVLCSPVVVNFSNDEKFQKIDCDVDI